MHLPFQNIAYQTTELQNEIEDAVQRVINHGKFILGSEVHEFEEKAAKYLGVKHAVGVNSGTDALIIALRSAGIKAGDEVITTPFTFVATAEAISAIGAIPVFADISENDYTISPESILQNITDKTKAILPVHLFGKPADMNAILEIASTYHLKVIEDCAQSFGAKFYDESDTKGKFTGAIGDAGAFSFFPTKNLGALGDAGLITTNDDELADTARMLRAHGTRKKNQNEIIGYNSRMDTIQAAVLLAKLPYVKEWNKQRRQLAKWYNQLLADAEGILMPEISKGHVFHQYTIQFVNGEREAWKNELSKNGIETAIYYPIPCHKLLVYKRQKGSVSCPVSEQAAEQVLQLPIRPGITQNDIEPIASIVDKLN